MRLLVILFIFLMTSCAAKATSPLLKSTEIVPINSAAIESIRFINDNSPETMTATISLWMKTDDRKIMARGKLYYEKKNNRWKVILKDPYLGTNLYYVLIQDGVITAYSTMDKIAIKSSIDASAIFSDRYDPAAIFLISTGKIPLIAPVERFTQMQSEDGDFLNASANGFTEKVWLTNNLPSSIEVSNSKGNTYHIKYYGLSGKTIQQPRKIHASEDSSGDYFDIEYSSVITGKPISESIFSLNIPRSTKVIQR